MQEARVFLANDGADVAAGNGLVGTLIRHEESELVFRVAGKPRHQIKGEFLATRNRQTCGFDDELQERTPCAASSKPCAHAAGEYF